MLTTIEQHDVVPVNTEKFLVLDKKTYCNVPRWSTNKKSQYDVVLSGDGINWLHVMITYRIDDETIGILFINVLINNHGDRYHLTFAANKSKDDVVGVLEATDNDDLENKVNFGIQSIVNHFGVTVN